MMNDFQNLPAPHPDALDHSQKLQNLIHNEIDASGGYIPFARFMELALYAPGLGYYTAGSRKFGSEGDFVTAPEISPLFSRCVARQCQQVLANLIDGEILEFGAGSGVMAADLLLELEQMHALPKRYSILEVSAELRERQQAYLKVRIPHLWDRIFWLDRLPSESFAGVILANEVLDAMPLHRFQLNAKGLQEFYVGWKDNHFLWHLDTASSVEVAKIISKIPIELMGDHYDSEINFMLAGWVKSLSQCLSKGLILLIDYGFPQHEYYHPDRSMGTLMCHYRHRAHFDPLILVGLQDITAHVDFTAVADAAITNGLCVAGFTTQAAFLLSCGLLDLAATNTPFDAMTQLKFSQQVQKLTAPHEMGELFKVIALTKELEDFSLVGFLLQDQRYRL